MGGSILIVEDDAQVRELLVESLQTSGWSVAAAVSGEDALEHVRRGRFDVIVSDILLPGMNGLEVLRRARALDPAVLVVLITGHATVDTAIEALRRGAGDYVVKPFDVDDLEDRIRRLLARGRGGRRDVQDDGAAGPPDGDDRLIGGSAVMTAVRLQVARAAAISSTVLLTGESGTGKEVAARSIHRASGRRRQRFVAVNCAAIAEGLFESHLFGHVRGAFTSAVQTNPGLFVMADRGSLFLDEVAELPPHLQAKLLRVIEEKQVWAVGASRPARVDVRIVAATNRDLAADVAAGRFRGDLYYRLNVVRIALPPLREHREDIPELVQHLLPRLNERLGCRFERVEGAALESLMAHDWPGNVRELQHALERAMTAGDGPLLTRAMLPDDLARACVRPSLKQAIRQFEREKIREALASAGFDKREAARLLGLSLASLYRKLDEPLTP